MAKCTLNRRTFLKVSVAAGAAAALDADELFVPAAEAAEGAAEETKIVKTCCRGCIQNCGVLAHVRNGRVVKLEGNPEYPMSHGALCAKGLSGITALYHPNRNKYPLIRVGKRGENKWKRISWKEAIDTIAKKMMEVREQYGAESVLVTTGGGGNPAFRGISRFCNAFGTPNFYEPGCAQCYLPRTLAFDMMYGGPDTSIADEKSREIYNPDTKMKSIVLWGTDSSYSSPATGGLALVELRAKGVKTVSIDPRFVPEAARTDVWLPVRPGTDVALMLAWMRFIMTEKLYDEDFVMHWTNLPYLVDAATKMLVRADELDPKGDAKTYVVWDRKTKSPKAIPYPWDDALDPALAGTFEWKGRTLKTGWTMLAERVEPWTLEAAGKECDLDPKRIEEAIRIYADGPSGIALGVATDQTPNSVQAAMGCVILNALTGNVERPGSLMQRNPTSNVVPAGSLATRCSYLLPKGQLAKRLGSNEHKGLIQWDAAQPSAVLDAMLTGKPYPIKVWLERSGNKMMVNGQAQSWVEAMKNVDLIVHMYMYPTSFSNYADILLPATEWLETNMLVESLNMIFARQAVAHVWETEDETLFWSKLAKRCAELGNENCKRACDPAFMKGDLAYWDSMEELLDQRLKAVNLTWKGLLEHNPYEYMPYEKWNTYGVYLEKDPKTGLPKGFRTPSKKLELYGEVFITLGRTGKPYALDEVPPVKKDYDPLPYYLKPSEAAPEIVKDFPLVLTNGRIPVYHHGTLRNSPFLREIYPVPELWINPATAAKYGLAQGDWAWIESKRGKIRGKCRLTEGMAPNVVYMERFWTPETVNTPTGGWQEMNVNVLTKNTAPFNDVVGTYTLRGIAVRVSKAPGKPEGVWEKPEDFKAWLPQPTDRTPNPQL